MLQDLRFAVRGLRRNPGFALAAILTLGLGIGANTAIFAILNAVALQPLDYAEPDRLFRVRTRQPVTLQVLEAWRERVRGVDALSGYTTSSATLIGSGDPLVLNCGVVSAEHFAVLGREPFLGRGFRSADHPPGAEPVVVLNHGLWMRRFGGDPAILGRSIALRDERSDRKTVVGVMPPDHRALVDSWQVLVPHRIDRDDPAWHDVNLTPVVRLAARTTEPQALEDVQRVARELHAAIPDHFGADQRDSVRLVPLRDALVGGVDTTLWILQASVALVLLIACANVANLLLARSTARRGEIAVRMALGASRGRVARQMLTEAALIGLLGGATGLGIAWITLETVRGRLHGLPRAADVGVDPAVALFAAGFALISAAVFGAIPALRAAGGNLEAVLRRSNASRSTGSSRMGSVIVGAEIALAVVLVAAAGLMLKSLWSLHQVPLGFDHERLLTLRLLPPPGRYATDEARRAYYDQVRDRVGALPGVAACDTVSLLPVTPGRLGLAYLAEGQPATAPGDNAFASYRTVSADYFSMMGIQVLEGRGFASSDRAGGLEVGILNRTMAHHLWPGENPIGKEIRWDAENPWFTVVGVVDDVRQNRLDGTPFDVIYRPYGQEAWVQELSLVVRTQSGMDDAAALAPSVRAAILAVDPEVPIVNLRTMDAVVATSLRSRSAITALLLSAAGLALALGAIGVYGVTAYSVGRRSREIGIRIALGATRRTVLRDVIVGNVTVTVGGLIIGVAGSLMASRVLQGLLFEVHALDAAVLGGVAACLLVSAGVASWIPARRAAATDPLTALRQE